LSRFLRFLFVLERYFTSMVIQTTVIAATTPIVTI